MQASFFFIVKVVISGTLIAVISSLAKTLPKWAEDLMTEIAHAGEEIPAQVIFSRAGTRSL